MADYYVLPPQDKYRGSFIISTSGIGYSRRYGKKKYLLVSALKNRNVAGEYVCELYFERDGILYRCVPGLPRVGGNPAVMVKGRRVMAPKALWPFADPDTFIRPV